MNAPVDVLTVLASYSGQHGDPEDFEQARAAIAELIKCGDVVIKAFEALGRSDGIVAQLESHRECERALIELKAAVSGVKP